MTGRVISSSPGNIPVTLPGPVHPAAANIWRAAEIGKSPVAGDVITDYTLSRRSLSRAVCILHSSVTCEDRPKISISSRVAGAALRSRAGQVLVYQIVLITVGHLKPPAPRILIFLLRDTNVSRRKNDKMIMNVPGRVSGGGKLKLETLKEEKY